MKEPFKIVLLTVVLGFLPLTNMAQETAKGGGKKLMELSEVKSQAQLEQLKPGDVVAMVCSKCKTVEMTYVTSESKDHVKILRPGEKHLCPGCKTMMEVVGHGKGKTDEVKHICKACGDTSAFCCATRPGAGETLGMREKK